MQAIASALVGSAFPRWRLELRRAFPRWVGSTLAGSPPVSTLQVVLVSAAAEGSCGPRARLSTVICLHLAVVPICCSLSEGSLSFVVWIHLALASFRSDLLLSGACDRALSSSRARGAPWRNARTSQGPDWSRPEACR